MEQSIITYRNPSIDDLESIIAINRISLPENYPVGYFIQLIKDWKESSVVAVSDKKIIGYIITRIEKFPLSQLFLKKYPKGHIISVAVLPEYRRQGVGKGMMDFVLNRLLLMENIKEVTLEVRESNVAAIHLYKNLSFFVAKTLERYYNDGESALVMVKELVQ